MNIIILDISGQSLNLYIYNGLAGVVIFRHSLGIYYSDWSYLTYKIITFYSVKLICVPHNKKFAIQKKYGILLAYVGISN